jgi:hypothetical protein
MTRQHISESDGAAILAASQPLQSRNINTSVYRQRRVRFGSQQDQAVLYIGGLTSSSVGSE